MDRKSKLLVQKVIADFTCVLIIGLSVLMFYLFAQPYHRGFFCDDESIKHPFKESTVTNTMLYIIGIFLPIAVMTVGEFIYAKNINGQSTIVLFGYVIPPWLTLIYHKVGFFLFGAASTILVTDVAKYTIGRLRPHFIDVCDPIVNCTAPENLHRYIIDFTCQKNVLNPRKLKEARLSFPSGHSSFSAYVMIYLALYLQLRLTWKGSRILRHFLQLICIILAWGTALSRISDYKHHWSDVLAGSLIGVIASLITVFLLARFFHENKNVASSLSNNDSESPNVEKLRSIDYDAETAIQDETSSLKGRQIDYGGVQIH